MSKQRLLFVYGSLREGMGNHPVLGRKAELLGVETLDGWQMYSYGGFPYIVPTGDADNSVTGEVYAVDEEGYSSVERLEGYPTFYDRMEVDTSFGKAELYHFRKRADHDLGVVASGDWPEFYNSQRGSRYA